MNETVSSKLDELAVLKRQCHELVEKLKDDLRNEKENKK